MACPLYRRLAENPVVYQRFSQLITETIEAYKAGRLSEADYLKQMQAVLTQVQEGKAHTMPASLHRYQHAQVYYGILQAILETSQDGQAILIPDEVLAESAIEIERLIEAHKIRDWTTNADVQRTMMNVIEDYLYEMKAQHDWSLGGVEMDLILAQVIETARQRDRL